MILLQMFGTRCKQWPVPITRSQVKRFLLTKYHCPILIPHAHRNTDSCWQKLGDFNETGLRINDLVSISTFKVEEQTG
jgi:hypothetical protein